MCIRRHIEEVIADDFHFRFYSDQDETLKLGETSHWCVVKAWYDKVLQKDDKMDPEMGIRATYCLVDPPPSEKQYPSQWSDYKRCERQRFA